MGLALALLAAENLPKAHISLWDTRSPEADISADPRTLALSLGSLQLLKRLQAWPQAHAQAINAVHVSQHSPAWGRWAQAEVTLHAKDEGVDMLGAVVPYGRLTHELQQRWLKLSAEQPHRLQSRFGHAVKGLKNLPLVSRQGSNVACSPALKPDGGAINRHLSLDATPGVELDAGWVENVDLAVVAEGGVFAQRESSVLDTEAPRQPLKHDYQQTAWVGRVTLQEPHRGVAYERFTREGPLALLPLLPSSDGLHQAALVWCVQTASDPVAELNDAQRVHVLHTLLHESVGPITAISTLKSFALGLQAHRTLTQGRTVRIGNAAQTLHPVAGQGLNLGLRDAYALVNSLRRSSVDAALRQLEWQRGPDRWALLATTDFLARSFAWQLPGANTLRGLSLAALQSLKPVKSMLARHMMFGQR